MNGSGNAKLNFAVAIIDGMISRIGISALLGFAVGMGCRGFWYGDALTKASHLFMGVSHIFRGQIVRGIDGTPEIVFLIVIIPFDRPKRNRSGAERAGQKTGYPDTRQCLLQHKTSCVFFSSITQQARPQQARRPYPECFFGERQRWCFPIAMRIGPNNILIYTRPEF